VRGELRGVGNEDDPNRFAGQWGLVDQNNFNSVDDWTTMDLGPIQVRTEPVPLAQYKVQFKAPAQSVFLFIRGWKKFAITNVEMDFNLDAISIHACDSHPQYPGTGGPVNQGQGYPHDSGQGGHSDNNHEGDHSDQHNDQGNNECYYIVKPGDTLSQIAVDFGVSLDAISRANGIDDPSSIYVGQKFDIPGCEGHNQSGRPGGQADGPNQQSPEADQQGSSNQTPQHGDQPDEAYAPQQGPQQHGGEITYVVQPGDMLSEIAEKYGVNEYELATYNGIDDMNCIYSGQVLTIPN